ncbi:MAG: hypothetical protein WC980_10580 [Candidatus Brocadiia bacterium]
MKVLTEVVFSIKPLSEVPPEIAKRWLDDTSASAEVMNNRRKAKIKNRGDYENLISEISSQKYRSYVDPNFISRTGLNKSEITAKHYKNCSDGYDKYNNKLDYVYETVDGVPAKRYKERVARAAANYGAGVAKKLLSFTGTKARGLGPAAMAPKWLDGDNSLRAGDAFEIIKGSAVVVPKPGLRSAFRAALEPKLIYSGAAIIRGDFQADVVLRHNDEINMLMNAMANPALNLVPFATGGDSHVDYMVNDAGVFLLHIKVTQK